MATQRYHHSDELLDELDATVLMLGRQMAAAHGELCHDSRLAGARLLLLRILVALGEQKIGDLAQNLGIKAPATSSLVDALEHDGYVVREHSADDRRVILVRPTSEGIVALQSAEAVRREKMRHYLSVLSEQDIRDMIRIQRTLIVAMVDDDS